MAIKIDPKSFTFDALERPVLIAALKDRQNNALRSANRWRVSINYSGVTDKRQEMVDKYMREIDDCTYLISVLQGVIEPQVSEKEAEMRFSVAELQNHEFFES